MFKPIESAPKDGTDILGLWFEDGFPQFSALAWIEFVDDPDYSGWYNFDDIAAIDKSADERVFWGQHEPQFWAQLDLPESGLAKFVHSSDAEREAIGERVIDGAIKRQKDL